MSLLTTEQLSELETISETSSFENFQTSEVIINFGLRDTVRENGEMVYKIMCKCGNVETNIRYSSCSKCGNEKFLSWNGCLNQGSINRTSRVYVTKLDDRELVVKRINFSIETLKDSFKVKKVTLIREMKINLDRKSIVVFRNGEVEFFMNQKSVNDYKEGINQRLFFEAKDVGNKMFRGYDYRDMVRMINNSIFEEFLTYSYYRIGNQIGNISTSNILVMFCRCLFLDVDSIIKIHNTGIFRVLDIVEMGDEKTHVINHNFNINHTKPHQIIGIPKFVIKYYKDTGRSSNNFNQIKKIKKFLENLQNNNLARELFDIAHNETNFANFVNSLETIISLHKDYDYKNLKKLVLYLTRTLKMYQGIENCNEAIIILRDYLRMNQTIGIESEKYPKSLKRSHDLAMVNYKSVDVDSDHYEMFVTVTGRESYRDLEYISDDKDFLILSPAEPKDLIDEGDALSHCVGSYVKEVAEEKCKIYFLRAKEEPDKPLATIELRNGNVVQAKTKLNYDLTDSQEEFVQEWAKEKRIYFNKY